MADPMCRMISRMATFFDGGFFISKIRPHFDEPHRECLGLP
eukprot:SAG31_NODE_4216_length_3454_cov_3.183308_2_plen_41_part_00